jgi:hypothetical protein
MARKPPRPTGTPLPADWRHQLNHCVGLMLASVPPADYETVAQAFERDTRGRSSDDWRAMWRAWCHDEMMRRAEVRLSIRPGMFG